MQVLQISDTHLFATAEKTLLGINTAASLAAVLRHVQKNSILPGCIILSGDLAQDCSAAAYQRLMTMLQPFSCPIYWLPGNHDAPAVMAEILVQPPFSAAKNILLGGWQFILLNSHYPDHVEGYLAESELAFLRHCLISHPKQSALIFLHHPPVPINCAWLDKSKLVNADALFAVTDQHPQVRGILCGHVHQAFATKRHEAAILSAPTTCLQFLPGSEKFALDTSVTPGYRQLTLNDDGTFTTQVARLPSFHYTIDTSAKGY